MASAPPPPHHRPKGFQNNYLEFEPPPLSAVLRGLRLGYHAHQERAVGPADGPVATTLVAALRSTFGVGGFDPDPAWTASVAEAGGLP